MIYIYTEPCSTAYYDLSCLYRCNGRWYMRLVKSGSGAPDADAPAGDYRLCVTDASLAERLAAQLKKSPDRNGCSRIDLPDVRNAAFVFWPQGHGNGGQVTIQLCYDLESPDGVAGRGIITDMLSVMFMDCPDEAQLADRLLRLCQDMAGRCQPPLPLTEGCLDRHRDRMIRSLIDSYMYYPH